jgi:hypothetical protein
MCSKFGRWAACLAPSAPWAALQALMDDAGQVTMRAVDAIRVLAD